MCNGIVLPNEAGTVGRTAEGTGDRNVGAWRCFRRDLRVFVIERQVGISAA